MNFLPRQAAVIARRTAEADFAESAIENYGFQVTRYDSTKNFAGALQDHLLERQDDDFALPNLVVLAGSLDELAADREAAAIHEIAPELPVVAAGSEGSIHAAVDLMKQGASDVVDLPCDRQRLWNRISETIDEADVASASHLRTARLKARYQLLTPAEREVLAAMLDGMANKQVALKLGIGLRTVELRRSKIMQKMQAKNVAELVKLVCLAGCIDVAVAETHNEVAT